MYEVQLRNFSFKKSPALSKLEKVERSGFGQVLKNLSQANKNILS
jgi:hypothetical protein